MRWINKYWAYLGGIVAVSIIIVVLLNTKGVFSIETLVWIHLAILLIHQFEEYSFPGRFKEFYNTNILNSNPITRYPLNDNGILLVNVILAWTIYLIAAINGEQWIWLTIGLAGITILNGTLHTLMYFVLKKYNPGLVSGLFMLVPFGLHLLASIGEDVEMNNWIAGIIVCMVGAALIPLLIRLTNN